MILLSLVLAGCAKSRVPPGTPPELSASERAFLLERTASVLVDGAPLASFVPELGFGFAAADAQAEIDRLLHLPPVRRCYAAALAERPAWSVVAALGVGLASDGTVTAEVYGTEPLPGLASGWAPDPAFAACIESAAHELATGLPATHVQVLATFRPAVELATAPPEVSIMGFGGE